MSPASSPPPWESGVRGQVQCLRAEWNRRVASAGPAMLCAWPSWGPEIKCVIHRAPGRSTWWAGVGWGLSVEWAVAGAGRQGQRSRGQPDTVECTLGSSMWRWGMKGWMRRRQREGQSWRPEFPGSRVKRPSQSPARGQQNFTKHCGHSTIAVVDGCFCLPSSLLC